jgi:uncharacterized protein (TIGR02996 family)
MLDPTLLRAILARPQDDAPRRALADHLGAQRDTDRAEFIRVQLELAGLRPNDPRRVALELVQSRLLARHRLGWLGELPKLPGVGWSKFERGLIGSAVVQAGKAGPLDACLETIMAAAPVHKLWIRGAAPADAQALAASPALARLTELDIADPRINAQSAAFLLASPHLVDLREWSGHPGQFGEIPIDRWLTELPFRRLEALRINAEVSERGAVPPGVRALDDSAARALADWAGLAGLLALDLSQNRIGDAGAEALARSTHVGKLEFLALGRNQIGDAGLAAFGQGTFPQLIELRLDHNRISTPGLSEFARTARLKHLTTLHLGHNAIEDEGLAALARAEGLPLLTRVVLSGNALCLAEPDVFPTNGVKSKAKRLTWTSLDLADNAIRPRGARALASWTGSEGLVELSLAENPLADEGAEVLAASPKLHGLVRLDLGGCTICDAGAKALAASPHLAGLHKLDLSFNVVTPQGQLDLAERFGERVVLSSVDLD